MRLRLPILVNRSIPDVIIWLLAAPPGLCVALALTALVPPALAGKAGAIAAFDAMMAFALLNPLVCARRSRWCLNTALSAVVWAIVFGVLGSTPGVTALGDGSMIFVVPFMIYPLALIASAVARFVGWQNSRHRPVRAQS